MNIYNIWCEGSTAPGKKRQVTYLGQFVAESFEEACIIAIVNHDWPMQYYDNVNNTYWGCKFYANEEQALRASKNTNDKICINCTEFIENYRGSGKNNCILKAYSEVLPYESSMVDSPVKIYHVEKNSTCNKFNKLKPKQTKKL